ncbi:hypothetical protein ACEPPN_016784 [Leptodophora sp. 'Broadleaf-Isolate-01']
MDRLFRQTRQLLQRSTSPPHGISSRLMSSKFVTLDNSVETEEETMPTHGLYYPVRLGEVFKSRYEVLSKLGYGANSTVWFCRDLLQQKYAALKVYRFCSSDPREIEVLKYLAAVKSEHVGKAYVRTVIDSFAAKSATGEHHCLVHEPLLLNLLELQATLPRKHLNLDLLKRTLKQLLLSLDYLHNEAIVIHSGQKLTTQSLSKSADPIQIYKPETYYSEPLTSLFIVT